MPCWFWVSSLGVLGSSQQLPPNLLDLVAKLALFSLVIEIFYKLLGGGITAEENFEFRELRFQVYEKPSENMEVIEYLNILYNITPNY